MKYLSALLLSFFSPFIFTDYNLSAQSIDYRTHRVNQFDISSGLSSNNILSLEQDQYGFIWVATAEGLNRFDGRNFVSFSKGKDNISLSNNYTQFLKCSNNGNIWIATSHGLNIYNYKADSIQIILENHKNNISSNDIICFSEARNGMWVATYDRGINFFDYRTRKFSKPELPGILSKMKITYIHIDRENNLWIGTLSNGLFRYSLQNKRLSYFNIPRVQEIIQDAYGTVWVAAKDIYYFNKHSQSLAVLAPEGLDKSMYATRIKEDPAGYLWIGFMTGLGYVNLKDHYLHKKTVFTEVRQKGKNYGAPFRAVNSIKIDKANNIWIGTFGDGMYMIHGEKDKFEHLEYNIWDKQSLSSNRISCITSDGKDRFYFGTHDSGLDVFNRNMEKTGNYKRSRSASDGVKMDMVLSILYDSDGNLWCGGDGLSVLRKGKSAFENCHYNINKLKEYSPSNRIYGIVETPDKSIWFATETGLIHYKGGEFTNEFHKRLGRRIDIRSIAVEGNNLWLGTYGDGIISYQTHTGRITFYSNREDVTENYIQTIKRNGDTLCVATQGAGIYLFSVKLRKKIKSFDISNGLKSNYIQAVEFDQYRRMWLVSNQGITCIAKNKIRHFDSKDGISRNEFFGSYKYVQPNGAMTIFFCGNDGVNYFDPNNLPQYSRPHRLIFNSLKIFNQPIRPSQHNYKSNPLTENIIMTEKIELSSNQSFFSVGFINIDYTYIKHMQYAYMLKGIDKDWSNLGTQQEVSFRNLPPGKYVLVVKASNFDDGENDSMSEMEIIIHPPFWRTNIAYFIYFILFCLVVYAAWKFSTIKMQAQHRLDLEKSERQKEEEIHQAKLRFYTNISHELRTPLTLIIGPLETLRQKYPSLEKEVWGISQNAQRLLQLVNQLLDFRKSELKEMKLKVKYDCITDHIRRIVSSFEGLRAEKKITFSFSSSPMELSGWYDGDFIDKILYNLLSNSYKFTSEEGRIGIEVSGFERDGVQWAGIKVVDNGIGIDDKEIELIFNRYYQAENSNHRKGSGIGLNLVKNLVELHHGAISVTSSLNNGACFCVEIPINKEFYGENETTATPSSKKEEIAEIVEQHEIPEHQKTNQETHKGSKESINILVVDDEIGICEYIKQILPESYHVIFAMNGREALSILNQQDFDIVISDVMMPEMDGITLCEKIKKNIETSHIPVILLTAKSAIEDKLEGLKSGADSYIPKPFHPEHLQIRVEKLIESRQMFKKKFGKTLSFELEHNENPSFDNLLLEKILKYINKHISDSELNGDKIAKDINLSRMTLHRKLKLLTGQTTSELIRGIRLKEAAYQIENTLKNISDICYEVGFNSPSYFTSCFAERYGMTPTEYLKAKRKNELRSN